MSISTRADALAALDLLSESNDSELSAHMIDSLRSYVAID